jgi:hypothetical protein
MKFDWFNDETGETEILEGEDDETAIITMLKNTIDDRVAIVDPRKETMVGNCNKVLRVGYAIEEDDNYHAGETDADDLSFVILSPSAPLYVCISESMDADGIIRREHEFRFGRRSLRTCLPNENYIDHPSPDEIDVGEITGAGDDDDDDEDEFDADDD